MQVQTRLEQLLNSFDQTERRESLEELVRRLKLGQYPIQPEKEEVNLHFHTFYSFNANGWSPSRIAWESVKYGLETAGIVDFDVLDGMDEFFSAGELLGLKTVVGLETRVFVSELADKVMSSPNEPGIAYFMAGGCFKRPPAGSGAERILNSMAETARERNLALIGRVNAYLDPVALDYDADALPLTPAGNATERHLLAAYEAKAREVFGCCSNDLAEFWAAKLGVSKDEMAVLLNDTPKFHEKMRSKLMKFGGVGYVAPTSGSFPSVEDAIRMMRGMDALPMITWLDGTNAGEEDTDAFLQLLISEGCVSLNIVPDRNWNIKDPDEKALKTRKLREVVEGARKFHLPISVGTEMNKAGLPFVDDFDSDELTPYRRDFVDGARCLYGHTVLARYADFGYFSAKAEAAFGDGRAAKNAFFTKVGRVFITPRFARERLSGLSEPGAVLASVSELE
jgi:hypothetical protein